MAGLIYHEPWYKSALDRDLMRLQEEAKRGDPDALAQLRRLQERSGEPVGGEDDATTVEDVEALIAESKRTGGAYIPFLTKTLQEVGSQLDSNAAEAWFEWLQNFIPQHKEVLYWILRAYDSDEHDTDQIAPRSYFSSLWDMVEKQVQDGKIKDPYVVGWLFRHEHPHEVYPALDKSIVLLALDSDLPKIEFEETYYTIEDGLDFWDNSGGQPYELPLREFLKMYSGDYRWEIDPRVSENPKDWDLRTREMYSKADADYPARTDQVVITFPNERDYTIRWLAKLMEPKHRMLR